MKAAQRITRYFSKARAMIYSARERAITNALAAFTPKLQSEPDGSKLVKLIDENGRYNAFVSATNDMGRKLLLLESKLVGDFFNAYWRESEAVVSDHGISPQRKTADMEREAKAGILTGSTPKERMDGKIFRLQANIKTLLAEAHDLPGSDDDRNAFIEADTKRLFETLADKIIGEFEDVLYETRNKVHAWILAGKQKKAA